MSAVIVDALTGLTRGLMSGTIAFFTVMLLSIVYRYFTNEKLSSFYGILFGLGLLGFSGGFASILDQPSFGGVIEVLVVSIVAVLGVNTGDKIAEKMPKRGASSILDSIRKVKHEYIIVKLPDARLIYDIAGKPRVPDSLKEELAMREFSLPNDLPPEEISNRVKRRLITDWGVGEVELELDQHNKLSYLAVSAKTLGLSAAIPEHSVAIPIECQVIPANLTPGDFVKVFLEKGEAIDRCEVKGVDEDRRTITIVAGLDLLEKIRGKKASLVVALPYAAHLYSIISIKKQSGGIEEFKMQKIIDYLKRVGISDEQADKIVKKVHAKLDKMDQPIPTKVVKTTIIDELAEEDPEAAKKLRTWKIPWIGQL